MSDAHSDEKTLLKDAITLSLDTKNNMIFKSKDNMFIYIIIDLFQDLRDSLHSLVFIQSPNVTFPSGSVITCRLYSV